MIKKIFFFYIFIHLCNICVSAKPYKIIATVNNSSITQVDLENEIEILLLLKNKEKSEYLRSIALSNIINELIKKKEIKNENLKIDNNIVNQYYFNLIKNLNLDENKIDKHLRVLIKEKIETDKLWNDIIIKKYSWKININMNEIEQKLNIQYKDKKNNNELKENLIQQEKNKKLAVFSKYHLNILKKKSFIKIFK